MKKKHAFTALHLFQLMCSPVLSALGGWGIKGRASVSQASMWIFHFPPQSTPPQQQGKRGRGTHSNNYTFGQCV